MIEKLYRIYSTPKGTQREEVGISPIEGIVTKARLQNHHIAISSTNLWLNIDSDELFSYNVMDATFRVDVGERVRLFPLDQDGKGYRNRTDFRRVVGLQVLDEQGNEKFRYNGKDLRDNYEIMNPDEEF